MPSLTSIAYDLLQPAINLGLSEFDFWNMTIAEIERYCEGATWRLKQQAQFDYGLANLIGLSVSRLFDNNNQFPSIEDAYPNLFEKELIEKQKEDLATQKSINNFMAFAMAINAKVKGDENDKL